MGEVTDSIGGDDSHAEAQRGRERRDYGDYKSLLAAKDAKITKQIT